MIYSFDNYYANNRIRIVSSILRLDELLSLVMNPDDWYKFSFF